MNTPVATEAGRLVALIAKWRGEKDGSGTPWAANYNGALEACAKDLERALAALLAEPGEAVDVMPVNLVLALDYSRNFANAKPDIGSTEREHIIGLCALLERAYTHPAAPVGVSEGVALIAAERRRQIEAEGWTPEHDDEHNDGAMALAAATYALPVKHRGDPDYPRFWPWEISWWKPGDRIRELTKAGALIAAEIERLHRAALQEPRKP
jgi:hypothetical protein